MREEQFAHKRAPGARRMLRANEVSAKNEMRAKGARRAAVQRTERGAKRRAQTSIETIILFGVSSVIILILLNFGLNIQASTQDALSVSHARTTVNEIVTTAEQLWNQGPGASAEVFIIIPVSIEEESGLINDRTLRFRVLTRGNYTDVSTTSKVNLTGVLPTIDGEYRLVLLSRENDVLISVWGTIELTTDNEVYCENETVNYYVSVRDDENQPKDTNVTINLLDTNGTVRDEHNKTTIGGLTNGTFVIPSLGDYGYWRVKVFDQEAADQKKILITSCGNVTILPIINCHTNDTNPPVGGSSYIACEVYGTNLVDTVIYSVSGTNYTATQDGFATIGSWWNVTLDCLTPMTYNWTQAWANDTTDFTNTTFNNGLPITITCEEEAEITVIPDLFLDFPDPVCIDANSVNSFLVWNPNDTYSSQISEITLTYYNESALDVCGLISPTGETLNCTCGTDHCNASWVGTFDIDPRTYELFVFNYTNNDTLVNDTQAEVTLKTSNGSIVRKDRWIDFQEPVPTANLYLTGGWQGITYAETNESLSVNVWLQEHGGCSDIIGECGTGEDLPCCTVYNNTDYCNVTVCDDCDGKVTNLTLRYDGTSAALIRVENKDNEVEFNNTVDAGEWFNVSGSWDQWGTFGSKIYTYINNNFNVEIHTSCSQPIGPGLVAGDFTVIAGESRNGGPLCPLEGCNESYFPGNSTGCSDCNYNNTDCGYTNKTVNYEVDNDGDEIKFEDADPGLGEDDYYETDTFIMNVTGNVSSISVKTKAGSSQYWSTLNSTCDSVVDGNGFRITLVSIEENISLVSCGGGGGECEEDSCCDGKVTNLTLQYNGNSTALIRVEQKKDIMVFNQTVNAGGQFTINGTDKKGTLGSNIRIFVDNVEHTSIHTSCSQPIGIGLVAGDFTIIAGESRNGGTLCSMGGGYEECEEDYDDDHESECDDDELYCGESDDDDCDQDDDNCEDDYQGDCDDDDDDCDEQDDDEEYCCDGKVTNLTLQYNGTSAALIRVEQKKDIMVFNQTVNAGGQFTINGVDKKDTLGTEITLFVDDIEHTSIHTSCSKPIGPGLIKGDFEVINGYSRNGGALCSYGGGGEDDDDDDGGCEGEQNVTQYTFTVSSDCGSKELSHIEFDFGNGVTIIDPTSSYDALRECGGGSDTCGAGGCDETGCCICDNFYVRLLLNKSWTNLSSSTATITDLGSVWEINNTFTKVDAGTYATFNFTGITPYYSGISIINSTIHKARYINETNIHELGINILGTCTDGADCDSGYCRQDFVEDSNWYCVNDNDDCTEAGVSRDDGYTACVDTSTQIVCNTGLWVNETSCNAYQGCDGSSTKATYCGWQELSATCTGGSGCGSQTPGTCNDCGSFYEDAPFTSCSYTNGLAYCDEGCGATCDNSTDYYFNDPGDQCNYGCDDSCDWGTTDSCGDPGDLYGNTCYYGTNGCDETGCTTSSEECPTWCIDDFNGGTCSTTTRTDPSVSNDCYYNRACLTSGCNLSSVDVLMIDYCDYCGESGSTTGDYSPALNATCSSSCPNNGTRYWDETVSRNDDCTSGSTQINNETYQAGYIYTSQTSAGSCDETECDNDCSPLIGNCNAGVCQCGLTNETVFDEDFAPTPYYDYNWSRQGNDWDSESGGDCYGGTGDCAHADGNCDESNDWIVTDSGLINLSGANEVYVDFYVKSDKDFDSGDYFRVWCYDGSSWVKIYEEDGGDWSGTTWYHRYTTADASCFISDARFKITIISNHNKEDLYVDNFRVIKES